MAERNLKPVSVDERDTNQRWFGFVALSALAHVGILVAVVMAPSFKTLTGQAAGTESGATLEMLGDHPAAEPQAAAGAAAASPTTSEVLLAESSDQLAVASAPVEAAPAEAAPVKEVVPAKAVAVEIPKPPTVKPVSVTKPEAVEVQTEDSPVAVQEEATATTQPEVTAQQEVQEVTEEKPTVEDAPAQVAETAKEEEIEAPAAAAPVAAAVEKQTPPASTAPIAVAAPLEASAPTTASNAQTGSGAGTSAQNTGGSPTGTSAAPSRGDSANTAIAVPLGAPLRDARTLIALPGNPKPTYPLPDRVAGHQGTTVLIGLVKPDGSMAQVVVERSSGSKLMDQSAAQAFKAWRYKPGQQGLVRYPVQFQLVGDAKEIPTKLRRQ